MRIGPIELSLAKIRLRAVWLLAPVYLVLARPSAWLIATGGLFALLGALLRAWAAGTIRKNVVLTTGGPYAYTRNPLYLGTFLIGLGLAAASGRIVLWVIFLVLFRAVYGPTMRAEEHRLRGRFGAAYEAYADRVPLFVPRLRPYAPGETTGTRFRIERYLGHREYQAALGLLIGFLALIAKLAWGD